MLPELIEYRVIGTIKGKQESWFCDCSYCEGHGGGRQEVKEVEYIYDAIDEADAERLAILEYQEEGDYEFVEWVNLAILAPGEKPPRPREVELVYLDRWNKGLGLPGEPVMA